MAENSANSGKFIRTGTGNLLVCLEINKKPLFFYMSQKGLRLPSTHEKVRGNYLTSQEWDNALKTWTNNPKIEELTGNDLKNANDLGPLIAKSFIFSMSREQIAQLPTNYVKFFRT